ncbi:MAG: murein L,D-transpeptidase catalytic domain family protein [Candidatus Pseudobacter hemicellulosilyticus]|uniref:Murein L,D-transpeptidase catalytic domain family protein n=1 Tax=Candidatus Pseudobacter hemicellulosilyticus TaxID=3121375 RepID=A0AAJ5WUE7_9BACT|nr:MAG: murein L,D-transpeptidase catalytic domain family protein [Pseudobacter sp.]
MYRPLKSVSFSLLCLFVASPVLISGTYTLLEERDPVIVLHQPADVVVNKSSLTLLMEEGTALYDSMQLYRYGLTRKAFAYAWKGYNYLYDKKSLLNSNILSICDFSQSSRRKRLYVLDMEQKKLLLNTYVAHGRRSGGEYAQSFSNNPESHKSSLGFYVTQRTYHGGHGLALKIRGLENGFNDKADARNIVVHGSQYVGKQFLNSNKFNGRSFGCPAVPAKEAPRLIQTIKNGSCLFIYHPNNSYLSKSKILND